MKKTDYYSPDFKYKTSLSQHLMHREVVSLDILSKLDFKNENKFYDVGCGNGFFLKSAKKILGNNLTYSGGDYSLFQQKKASSDSEFKVDIIDLEEKFNYQDNYFDCVYSGEVIEHLFNPDNMVSEMYRALKPGGYFLCTTPNMNSWCSRIVFLFGIAPITYECSTVSGMYGFGILKKLKKQSHPVGHVRLFNYLSLKDIFTSNGFEVVELKGAIFESMPKKIIWIDYLFSKIPSLSSDLVILGRKPLK